MQAEEELIVSEKYRRLDTEREGERWCQEGRAISLPAAVCCGA